ncbi:MAG: hypothetical protein QXE66_02375 [Desulfurococcaceae archaeon]
MRITYIVAKAFAQWVKKVTPDEVYDYLEFDPDDIQQVMRWLEETCSDLEYTECKELFIREYLHGMRKKEEKDIEYENLMYSEMQMDYYFGTRSISEAFKKVYSEYKNKILSVNVDPRSIDELPLFSILVDYITAKYKCIDYSVETINSILRFTHMIESYDPKRVKPEELWTQISMVFNIKPAIRITELVFTFDQLALFYPAHNEIYYLLCYFEPMDTEQVRAVILTHNVEHPTLVISVEEFSPGGRILRGKGALIY